MTPRSLVVSAALISVSFATAGCGLADDLIPPSLGKRAPLVLGGCVVGGCSSQLCADEPLDSTCEYRPEYACFQTATCERQADGQCGWTQTPALTACLGGGAADAGTDQDGGAAPCVRGGCSGQLCSDQSLDSTCEWIAEYQCYDLSACERQAHGQCGWSENPAFLACLAAH